MVLPGGAQLIGQLVARGVVGARPAGIATGVPEASDRYQRQSRVRELFPIVGGHLTADLVQDAGAGDGCQAALQADALASPREIGRDSLIELRSCDNVRSTTIRL
jgi:hypothetical protein